MPGGDKAIPVCISIAAVTAESYVVVTAETDIHTDLKTPPSSTAKQEYLPEAQPNRL